MEFLFFQLPNLFGSMNSPNPEASKLVSHLMPYVRQGVSDFLVCISFLLFFKFLFKNNNKNCALNSTHQKLCNSLKIHMEFLFFQLPNFFGSILKKGCFSFFSRLNNKNWATKKLKLPSESLDNFASCHAAVFKLRIVSLFFY